MHSGLVPGVIALPAIPAKDGKPDGDGSEDGDDNNPGEWFVDVTVAASHNVRNSTLQQQDNGKRSDDHPYNSEVSFQVIHRKRFAL